MELFKLFGKIVIDGGDEANSVIDGVVSKAGNLAKSLGSGVAKAAATVGKTVAAGAVAGTAAVTALTKSAVDAYAEYEQLVGGVETLYGQSYQSAEEYAAKTGSSLEFAQDVFAMYSEREQTVLDNAANAYKTAGMSANEYMETVNGFAASLTGSLGQYEWQAGHYADMIVTDMADNANKMGTDMTMIQNAYSGFAKGNFTMLDNLKLGYGGTQQEMDRLLRKAEEIEGYEVGAFDRNKFADVAEAIHIIQEEMGIFETTKNEAAATISGSLAMTKAAWENLLVGIADPSQDMSALTQNLIDSAVTAADNLVPRIGEIVGGIGSAIMELAPQIGEAFSSLAPMIGDTLSGALSLVGIDISSEDIMSTLETAFSGITEIGGSVIDSFVSIGESIGEGFGLVQSALADNGITFDAETLFGGIANGVEGVGQFIGDAFVSISGVIADNMGGLVEMFSGLGDLFGGIFSTIGGLVSQIDFSQVFGGWLDIINAVIGALSGIGSAVGSVIGNITGAFSGVDFGAIFNGLVSGITTAVDLIGSAIEMIITAVGAIAQPIIDVIAHVITQCQTAGTTLNAVWTTITGAVQTAVGIIKGVIATLTAVFQGDFKAAGEAAKQVGETIISGLTQLFENLGNVVRGIFSDLGNSITEAWNKIRDGAKQTVENIKNFFTNLKLEPPKIDFSGIVNAAKNAWNTIKSIFTGDVSTDAGGTTVTANAKANADGAILKRATLFGKVGNTYQIGGEAGPEAVAPIDTLQGYVKASVSEAMAGQNVASADAFAASATAIVDELRTMTDEIVSALNNTSITINNRTFGRLVREV